MEKVMDVIRMEYYNEKVAIVTGEASGIGKALCLELARLGTNVIVADMQEVQAKQTAEDIIKNGGKADFIRVDVSSETDVQQLVEDTVHKYGKIDFIFNNAGIAIGGDVRDLTMDQWKKVMDVNWNGVLYGTTITYKVMAKQGFGHIVNTASATGLMPQPGNAPYCASKHAVVGLSLSLRHEGSDLGVKVSTVCPGHVQTDIYKNMTVANVNNERMVASLPTASMHTKEAVDIILGGVKKNLEIIIFPNSVRWAWRLHRWFPRLLDKAWIEKIRNIRKLKQDH